MKITKTIETPGGSYTFDGEISEVEHDFILEAGLNFLLQRGMIPFQMISHGEIPPPTSSGL
jgi:hypothetical protein